MILLFLQDLDTVSCFRRTSEPYEVGGGGLLAKHLYYAGAADKAAKDGQPDPAVVGSVGLGTLPD